MNDSLLAKAEKVRQVIDRNRDKFASVVRPTLTKKNTFELRLSDPNNIVAKIDPSDADGCWETIENELNRQKKVAAIGGYGEKRTAYRSNPDLFGSEENERCIHLGIDIWMAAETKIYAPLSGRVHSFADNASLGNYGPTIILEHNLEDVTFYTLYGHLSRASIIGLAVDQQFEKGEPFASIGFPHENGHWVPHLHYQFIVDMLSNNGDFPGVSTEEETDFYLKLCPKPVVV